MAQRIRENSGTSRKAESTPTPAAPTKMPSSAVAIGRPIATTDPKATSSTMMATPTPMSSLLGSSCARRAREPVSSTCTPSASAWSVTAMASSSWVAVSLSSA